MPVPEELYNIKFAGFIESIKILYLQDGRFKTICDDYCINKVKSEKSQKKIKKYFKHTKKIKNLLQEQEEEILIYLIRRM